MTLPGAADLLAFAAAAGLVTVVPGLDTALVLRTAIAEGATRALLAGAGVAVGCLVWGVVVAAGLGALLEASEFAYSALRLLGACYLAYLGCRLIWSPRREFALGGVGRMAGPDFHWLVRGLLTNILNPKVGIFYVSSHSSSRLAPTWRRPPSCWPQCMPGWVSRGSASSSRRPVRSPGPCGEARRSRGSTASRVASSSFSGSG